MEPHRIQRSDASAAHRERRLLHLVRGDGIVPLAAQPASDRACEAREVMTVAGRCTLADVLVRRRLGEAECRGVGVQTCEALARVHAAGVVHGDVKPANIVLAPGGGLWLIDFDTAGASGSPRSAATPARIRGPGTRLSPADDVRATAQLLLECATGFLVDLAADWSPTQLATLGCPDRLATVLAAALTRPPPPQALAAALARPGMRLPPRRGGRDRRPHANRRLPDDHDRRAQRRRSSARPNASRSRQPSTARAPTA